jgi:outer membrane protein
MKKILASLMLAAVSAAAFAQTNPPAVRAMSLAECLTEAIQHNFDVRVARYAPELSRYDLKLAYAGYDPSFNFSGTHSRNDAGGLLGTNSFGGVSVSDANSFRSGLGGLTPWGMSYDVSGNVANSYGTFGETSGGAAGVNLTQPLLKNFLTDNTRTTIAVAKNRLKFSEQTLRQQFIGTVTDVENAYYELIYARENFAVQQQALALAQTLYDQDKKRVELGSMAPLDVQQDEAQVASKRADLIAAQFNLARAENALKNLITDNYPQWHDVELVPSESLTAAAQPLEVQASWARGLAQRPDLIEAKLNVEQQGIQLRYLRNQVYPQLDLTASYGVNGAGREFQNALGQQQTGSRPFYTYGAQFSIPLGNAAARNSLKSGRVTQQQLLLALKKLEQSVMVDIDNAVKSARASWEGAEASKQARIYAEAALDAEQKKYAVGKSTTFTVLQLQNNLTTARSQEIRALANYQESLTSLAAQEGSTLERRKLDLIVK